VLVSSHVLAEIAQTVDQIVIISVGRLRYAGTLDQLGEESLEAAFLRLTADTGGVSHAVRQ
jgi:ABC-2 type transport system ATP-binding protein